MTIWGILLSDNAAVDEDEPSALFTGCIHAEELIGTEVCHYAIQYLLENYHTDPQVTEFIDELQIYFVPIVNPEGHKVVTDSLDLTYRKNKRDNNLNGVFDYAPGSGGDMDGVDLNRNFPFNWEGGTDEFISVNYRGPSPGSETEIQAIMELAKRFNFLLSVFYHSSATGRYNEWVIYPWNWSGYRCPDYSLISGIAHQLAENLVSVTGGYYQAWYSVSQNGNANDWQYSQIGTIPFIVEIDTTTQPEVERLPQVLENQLNGLLYLLKRTLGPGLCVHLIDSITGEPIVGRVELPMIEDTVIAPRMTDPYFGVHRRLLQPGSYTVVCSAENYFPDTSIVNISDAGFTDIEKALAARSPYVGEKEEPDSSRCLFYCAHKKLHYQVDSRSTLKLYNISGRRVFGREIDNPMGAIDLRELPYGMYIGSYGDRDFRIIIAPTP